MRLILVAVLTVSLWGAQLVTSADAAGAAPWQCGSRPQAPCFKHRGRLSSQNGIGLKIWLIGTTRVVGLENTFEGIPSLVLKYLEMTSSNHSYIYGDFDICPMEPDTPGHLRRVCVVGAEHLVVRNLRGSRPPFRLLSTWPAVAKREGRLR
jgi:hypothetical protein